MSYQPIENYGIIGDMHTVALVGINGSIDWFCYPYFDSPSVFAAILDDTKGGCFRIAPDRQDVKFKQLYFPDTNVLITRFLSTEGVGEVTDFMPVERRRQERHWPRLIRRVSVVRGAMAFRVECRPAFDYARAEHRLEMRLDGAVFHGPALSLALATHVALDQEGDDVVSTFVLREGEGATFLLQHVEAHEQCPSCFTDETYHEIFLRTVTFWRDWLASCQYRGLWHEMVHRSALLLKLLTFDPSGAIVAAPTTSLPEGIGGERNWDYRYTWIRDASFTLYALLRIGFTQEATRFMNWLQARCTDLSEDEQLQIMYGVDGRRTLKEETLSHLDGYRGSRPVRVGNDAYRQLQLDIYGELMDSVYLFNKHVTPISYDLWESLRRLVDWVCENWQREDDGIWEVRGGRQHFVYSKLMCWVALDRALRLADKRSFPTDRERWLRLRDLIYRDIMARGWNPARQAFVQSYGGRALDSSLLLMPLVFFLSPTDPRMLATIEGIQRELVADSLVHRYNVAAAAPDGLGGNEGTFSMCTFWLVESLTRAGRLEEARLIFEKMLGYANHLGLYAEMIGPRGEALGNFPQAFTHLGLISAAYNLNRRLRHGH